MTRRILLALLVLVAAAGCVFDAADPVRGIPSPLDLAVASAGLATLATMVGAVALLQVRPGLLPGLDLRGGLRDLSAGRAVFAVGLLLGTASAFFLLSRGVRDLPLLLLVPAGFRALRRSTAADQLLTCRDLALVAFASLVFLGNPASVVGAVATTLLLAALLPGLQGDRAVESAWPEARAAAGGGARLPGAAWAVPAVAILATLLFLALPRKGGAPAAEPAAAAGLRPVRKEPRGDGPIGSATIIPPRKVSIGDIGRLQLDMRPILEVTVLRGGKPADAEDLGPLFRSGALEEFDGTTWASPEARALILPPGHDGFVTLPRRRLPVGEAIEQRLRFFAGGSDALFSLGMPTAVGGSGAKDGVLLVGRGEVRAVDTYAEGDAFTIRSTAAAGDYPCVDGEPITEERRGRLLEIPPGHDRAVALARDRLGGVDFGPGRRLLRRLETFLQRRCRYSLDIAPAGAASPVEAFLFDARRGHCELFASAAAVMLRGVGIPSRVVIGFRGGTMDPVSRRYTLRGADAHAWVEAWIDGQGWLSFDPTPSAGAAPQDRADDASARADEGAAGRGLLDGILRFDGEAQGRLFREGAGWAAGVFRDAFVGPDGTVRRGVIAALAFACALLAWALLRSPAAVTAEERAAAAPAPAPPPESWSLLLRRLEAAGFRRAPAETGLELAARAAASGIGPVEALLRVADAYAAERFGGRRPSPEGRSALLALAATVALQVAGPGAPAPATR